jgi:AraC-like DNA-binding protein
LEGCDQPVSVLRLIEPSDVMAAMPGVVVQITPLGASPFLVELVNFNLRDLILVHGRCSPLMLVGGTRAGMVAMQLPLHGTETLILNGRPSVPHAFCLYGPRAQIVRSNQQENSYAVLALPEHAAIQHLAPAPPAVLVRAGEFAHRVAEPHLWRRLAGLVEAARSIALVAPEVFATEPPRMALRASLLDAARAVIASGQKVKDDHHPRAPDIWRRVVLGAEEYLQTRLDRPIYTDELCEVLNVSAAALSEAFRGALGTTPHRYLKLRRLNLVRAQLRRRDLGPQLVKAVALSHGFWHLGQFSRDYRDLFGETPSETLASAQPHGPAPD